MILVPHIAQTIGTKCEIIPKTQGWRVLEGRARFSFLKIKDITKSF